MDPSPCGGQVFIEVKKYGKCNVDDSDNYQDADSRWMAIYPVVEGILCTGVLSVVWIFLKPSVRCRMQTHFQKYEYVRLHM